MLIAAQLALGSLLEAKFLTRSRVPSSAASFGLDRSLYFNPSRGGAVRRSLNVMANGFLATRSAARMVSTRSHLRGYADVDAVIDISGFAHSEMLGESSIVRYIRFYSDVRRRGKKVIFLPKTFGPFYSDRIKSLMAELIDLTDLVFARDRQSLENLKACIPASKRNEIRLSPDYTGGVPARIDERYSKLRGRACVIPNLRIVTNTKDVTQTRYEEFLRNSLQMLSRKGKAPYVLLHQSSHDAAFKEELQAAGYEVIVESDAQTIKGIIASSELVLSSRFHGIINALSQGVPAISVGWAHKYAELMEEYGIPEYSIEAGSMEEEVALAIDRLDQETERSRVIAKIRESQMAITQKNTLMWKIIAEVIA